MFLTHAPGTHGIDPMSRPYFVTVEVHGKNWVVENGAALAPELQPYAAEHFGYLAGLFQEGKIAMAGPLWDASAGIVVWNPGVVDTWNKAKQLSRADPFITNKIADFLIREWSVGLPPATLVGS